MTESQLTQESFLMWLHNQSSDRAFDYCDPQRCLFAAWVEEAGLCATPHCCSGLLFDGGQWSCGNTIMFPLWMKKLDIALQELSDIFTVNQVREVL